MPIDYARWIIEHQVLFARAYDAVSRAEMVEHNQIVLNYLNETQTPLHIILDDSTMGIVEPSFLEVQRIITFQNHPQIGWVVHISSNRVIRHFANLMARISSIQYQQFNNLEDSLAFLQQQHPELQWDAIILSP